MGVGKGNGNGNGVGVGCLRPFEGIYPYRDGIQSGIGLRRGFANEAEAVG